VLKTNIKKDKLFERFPLTLEVKSYSEATELLLAEYQKSDEEIREQILKLVYKSEEGLSGLLTQASILWFESSFSLETKKFLIYAILERSFPKEIKNLRVIAPTKGKTNWSNWIQQLRAAGIGNSESELPSVAKKEIALNSVAESETLNPILATQGRSSDTYSQRNDRSDVNYDHNSCDRRGNNRDKDFDREYYPNRNYRGNRRRGGSFKRHYPDPHNEYQDKRGSRDSYNPPAKRGRLF